MKPAGVLRSLADLKPATFGAVVTYPDGGQHPSSQSDGRDGISGKR